MGDIQAHIQNRHALFPPRSGGTVSGLTSTGLVLQNNGADPVTVNANGAFTFPTALTNGATYNVTVSTQPAGLAWRRRYGV